MADKTAVQSGNWNTPATWGGTTVADLPTITQSVDIAGFNIVVPVGIIAECLSLEDSAIIANSLTLYDDAILNCDTITDVWIQVDGTDVTIKSIDIFCTSELPRR
jgi:endonuclease V-like protein UPF0215 family